MLPGHGLIHGSGEEGRSAIIRPDGGRAIVGKRAECFRWLVGGIPKKIGQWDAAGRISRPKEAVEFLERPL